MKVGAQFLLLATGLLVCSVAIADSEAPPTSATQVVSKFYEHLRASDVHSMDTLFFKIPIMETHRADWLALIEHVAQKVEDEQLDWEVVCGKELTQMAVVIVNQTLKYGKKHADPDAMYLVKEKGRWLLLPDVFADTAKQEVRSALSEAQLQEQWTLRRWTIGEIRGMTTDCS